MRKNQTGDRLEMYKRDGSRWVEKPTHSTVTTNRINAHQDTMELWQTISNLASANQQLAAAHSCTLNQLQWCFNEFRKSQRQFVGYEISEKHRNAKTSCSGAKNKENHTKMHTEKPRHATSKLSSAIIKAMNRRLRRRKKLSTTNEFLNIDINNKGTKLQEIETDLRKEIEELKILRMESQAKNERLTNDLKDQRLLIEQLTQDFEDSRQACEEKEKSLEQVSGKLRRSELESATLLVKLETFQCEKCSGAKITKEEAEKILILKARLVKQDEENKKQLLKLNEATQRIRDLESTIQELTTVEALQTNESENSQPSTSVSTSTNNEEFKKELMLKREARQRAIAAISAEMDRLKSELEREKLAHSETMKLLENLKQAQGKSNTELKTDDKANLKQKTDKNTSDRVEALRLFDVLKISDEVTNNLWLQLERTDDLRFQLENDPDEHRLRIASLKRLSEDTRTKLRFRKQQVNLLKDRLAQILVRMGDRCFLDEPDDIRIEAERQIEDIGRSRNICDERSRILAELKDHCFKEIHELKLKLDNSKKDNQNLEEELNKIEDKMDAQDAEILNLESQLGLSKADCRDLQNQMSVINSLFTQMLLGASSAEMDLDRLTRLLQENHDLISEIAKENGTEAAALPKLLLDIIQQVDGRARENEAKTEEDDLQQETIAHNLPKVWRVLLELLSCHAVRTPGSDSSCNSNAESAPDSCYKSVDTPTGPRLVISVSKTYIRLKELILEKKHLEKEMNRMKQLNTHLESKLSEQEKRLSTVSDELSKTWNIVGRMQAQHQQLHTHEKILRYELQQKRKMLQELKQELEYCREKWESARQKNTNTEMEWKSLRREFAARKALVIHADSFNNSGESGFSDEREEESDEDENDENIGKRIRPINSRRRLRKDGAKTMVDDTESEQPTDNELSEAKTVSSSTSGQRTPTPETETELENSEIIEEDTFPNAIVSDIPQISDNIIYDPLDKALTNVIQQLIDTDESNYIEASSISGSDSENVTVDSSLEEIKVKKIPASENSNDQNVTFSISIQSSNETSENIIQKDIVTTYPTSVFTIGPIPNQIVTSTNNQFSGQVCESHSNVLLENTVEVNTNESNVSMQMDDKVPPKTSELLLEMDNVSIASSSSFETVKEFSDDQCEINTTLSPEVMTVLKGQTETNESMDIAVINDCSSMEVFDERAARLRNLEEQAEWLVRRVNATNRRSSDLSSRLEVLHETYGSTSEAPPIPDILSTFELQTDRSESENSATGVHIGKNEEKIHDD